MTITVIVEHSSAHQLLHALLQTVMTQNELISIMKSLTQQDKATRHMVGENNNNNIKKTKNN